MNNTDFEIIDTLIYAKLHKSSTNYNIHQFYRERFEKIRKDISNNYFTSIDLEIIRKNTLYLFGGSILDIAQIEGSVDRYVTTNM